MFNPVLPQDVSTFGPDIDHLFFFIACITGFFFVVLELLLLYIALRYRHKPGSKSQYLPGDRWVHIRWFLGLALVCFLLDLTIDAKGEPLWALIKESIPQDAGMTVKVVAQQFNWTFLYPDANGSYDSANSISSLHDLHIPVNTKIQAILTSQDVIHSFFMPELRVKQDVLPQRQIPTWFEATQIGTYDIVCAELCGFGHTRMTATLYVDDEKTFEAWKASMLKQKQGTP